MKGTMMRKIPGYLWAKFIDFIFDVLLAPFQRWLELEILKEDIKRDNRYLQEQFITHVMNKPETPKSSTKAEEDLE